MTAHHPSTAGTAEPHRSELRAGYHRDLERLEQDLQALGVLARAALQEATRSLTADDQALCRAVVDADDEIDGHYLDIERRVSGCWPARRPSPPSCACSPPSCTSTCTWSASATWR